MVGLLHASLHAEEFYLSNSHEDGSQDERKQKANLEEQNKASLLSQPMMWQKICEEHVALPFSAGHELIKI